MWDLPLSTGPILRGLRLVATRLEPIMESLRQALQSAPVVNTDETGMRVEGHLAWFHTVSTPGLTFLFAHARRGRAAVDAMDILPHRTGTTVTILDQLTIRVQGLRKAPEGMERRRPIAKGPTALIAALQSHTAHLF